MEKKTRERAASREWGSSCGLIELLHVLDPAVGPSDYFCLGLDGNGIRWGVSISRWPVDVLFKLYFSMSHSSIQLYIENAWEIHVKI